MSQQFIRDLYKVHGTHLDLELVAGHAGLNRSIPKPKICQPGLGLAGYFQKERSKNLFIFSESEVSFMKQLSLDVLIERLDFLLASSCAIIVTKQDHPSKEFIDLCNRKKVPLFLSSCPTMELITRLIYLLEEAFAVETTVSGTLVDVFGIGLLIQGESSIGKSEAALGLLQRGHLLVSDDVVRIKRKREGSLIGSSPKITAHHMEIRGIGIIDVSHLYGSICVGFRKTIDLIVRLEEWKKDHLYDRLGMESQFLKILEVQVPLQILPIHPKRDVVLLIETIALNHRLKEMGHDSARRFHAKLLKMMHQKQKKRVLA